jgi:hypothetical protein
MWSMRTCGLASAFYVEVGSSGAPMTPADVSNEDAVMRVSSGADDGIRTRDPHLGKVVLYQLSHVRAAPPS